MALEVFTREDFPVEWARTQNILANTYKERLTEAVNAFLNAQTREKSKRIVEEHRDVLLTDAVEEFLTTHFSSDWTGPAAHHHTREEQLTLLGRCRREGIDAAFAGLLHSPAATPENKLEALIEELDSPSLLDDIARRIAPCREALTLIDRRDQPELWAWLHVKQGDHLRKIRRANKAQFIEEAISHYELALEVYTREDFPADWARTQNNLAIAYRNRIRGEKADNVEQAILHYEQALEVYIREDFPADWALIQDRLANAYVNRRRREAMAGVDEIIKVAVLAFVNAQTWEESKHIIKERQDVLLTDAADKFLADLVRQQYEDHEHATHHTLKEHRKLLTRCRQEGIDAPVPTLMDEVVFLMKEVADWWADKKYWPAFAVFLVKEILTYGSTPVARRDRAEAEVSEKSHAEADSHVALSDRLQKDPQGDNRARNIEESISHLKQALEGYTRLGFQAESKWARTYQELAQAYENRIKGDRAQNIEEAISYYELVFERTFKAHTRERSPEYWAATHHNLAGAYSNRIKGDREQNIEEAIRHYELALEVRTRQDYPVEWASTQNNLAIAYEDRIKGDRKQNIEKAIRHCELALEVRTRERLPVDWAATQHNLANAYLNRGGDERAENIEEAISRCELALEVYPREDFPVEWARIQDSLGSAYRYRIRGKKAENVEEAIRHYELALEVLTPDTLPQDCRDTAYTLGSLLHGEGRFAEAWAPLTTAHEAVEAIRRELQREGAKQRLAEENADLYARLVHCCLMEGGEEAAFEYAVAGKGRAFVDMLATARFDLSAAGADDPQLGEDLRQARELRQQIDNLLVRLSGEGGTSSDEDEEQRSVRSQMQESLRSLKDQEARHLEEMSFRYPALTATQQTPSLSVEEAQKLSEELGATLVECYRHAGGWCAFVVTPDSVGQVPLPGLDDDLLERMRKWLARIESPKESRKVKENKLSYEPLRRLHRALIAPLRHYLPPGGRVVLAPFADLHLLPLGAALDPTTERYVAEEYTLTFAPNLAALRTARQGASSAGGRDGEEDLLSVAYPDLPTSESYLPNVLPEAEAVARHFARVTPLYEEAATPEAVLSHARGQDVLHLGCHGNFDAQSPQQSGLMLSGGWLTVQRIITELHLEKTRLATIGACLSGRVYVRQGEEHVGLVQAMMSAGAGAVVASLWPVDDAATRTLFEVFYAEGASGDSPAGALADAGALVRSRPGWEHPYYWAAFQVSGLAHGPYQPGLSNLSEEVVGRIEDAHRESMQQRGGLVMDGTTIVRDSLVLVEQMGEEPEAVLAALGPADREKVVAGLGELSGQAAGVRTEAELLGLADAIHRLVEDTPALADLLLEEGSDPANQRTVPPLDDTAHSESQSAMEHAAQIRNHVAECKERLERGLQSEAEERS